MFAIGSFHWYIHATLHLPLIFVGFPLCGLSLTHRLRGETEETHSGTVHMLYVCTMYDKTGSDLNPLYCVVLPHLLFPAVIM